MHARTHLRAGRGGTHGGTGARAADMHRLVHHELHRREHGRYRREWGLNVRSDHLSCNASVRTCVCVCVRARALSLSLSLSTAASALGVAFLCILASSLCARGSHLEQRHIWEQTGMHPFPSRLQCSCGVSVRVCLQRPTGSDRTALLIAIH